MLLSLIAPLLSLAVVVFGQDLSTATVKKAFDDASIPQDIELKFDPVALLEVTFPQNDSPPVVLNAGIMVPRNDTAGPPKFGVIGDVGNGPFVVATVDPDAPTPADPTEAQIRHFLGGNFFSNNGLLVNNTPAISEFQQPTPPAGSPAHRYIFMVFHQPAAFNQQKLINSSSSISNFNISVFAREVGLGEPIAGTFMLVAPPS
ncbi:hypothetical protein HMN09_00965800 [Mycena chlorophos]|uniref:PEBP-like protein n=1 Tax=Mycena chlorophos TaxID=658473 RepID=A0A8H6W553_MYCCL|nr:hypothetical protein HMN09_00965800 [Mycena chlorophos]